MDEIQVTEVLIEVGRPNILNAYSDGKNSPIMSLQHNRRYMQMIENVVASKKKVSNRVNLSITNEWNGAKKPPSDVDGEV